MGFVTDSFFDGPWPRAFAHRGWHLDELVGMENSLSACTRAVKEGYRYIETDVRATADGVAVLHHDATLNRTTDGRGMIARLPWATVRTARIAGREPVCRLDDLLEALPATCFNIDVKEDNAVEPTLRTLRRHDAFHRVCLASFDERRIRRLARSAGAGAATSMGRRSTALAWMASRLGGRVPRGLPERLAMGAAAQVPERVGALPFVDGWFRRQLHHWRREMHVWTVDDAARMRELLDLGVDGIVTDRPDLLNKVLTE